MAKALMTKVKYNGTAASYIYNSDGSLGNRGRLPIYWEFDDAHLYGLEPAQHDYGAGQPGVDVHV